MHAYRENATSRVFGQSNDQFVEMILKKFFLDLLQGGLRGNGKGALPAFR